MKMNNPITREQIQFLDEHGGTCEAKHMRKQMEVNNHQERKDSRINKSSMPLRHVCTSGKMH